MKDDINSDPTFNLVTEPWIPVTYTDEHKADVSLSTVFKDADQIQEISDEFPQFRIVLLRFLIAILLRAYSSQALSKRDALALWSDLWTQRHFDSEYVDEYLEHFKDRFDILSPVTPFYQVADLTYSDEKKEYDWISELVPDIPKPDKYLFAMKERSSSPPCIKLSEAARYLILAQAFDFAGIKSPVEGNTQVKRGHVYAPHGVVQTGFVGAIGGVYVRGRTLYETLLFNMVLYDSRASNSDKESDVDLPPWERSLPSCDIVFREPNGPVDLLTWQSRRIRLIFDGEKNSAIGVVICYGDATVSYDKHPYEWMTAWRSDGGLQKKLGLSHTPWVPLKHDPSKTIWEGLSALLAARNEEGADVRPGVIRWNETLGEADIALPKSGLIVSICAQGIVYNIKKGSSAIIDSIDDHFDLDVSMMRHDAQAAAASIDLVSRTDQAVLSLMRYVRNMESSAGYMRQNSTMENDIRECAYSELNTIFRKRLSGFTPDQDIDSYSNDWKEEVRSVLLDLGKSYASAASSSAFSVHRVKFGKKEELMTSGKAQILFYRGLTKALGSPTFNSGSRIEEDSHVEHL
ncbi:CRISPR-associated protein, Cse1 family [Coriobacterium glomerans PW2]|uniref:CRISPR-associated protein, Cse1 family n=2 Tax=Coriobacterium TaxID=33870 RepID=F2NAL2_CORGP|nr:CRISPR-associated protein, Cse1 family [Coriobacterium glomerans PW2]